MLDDLGSFYTSYAIFWILTSSFFFCTLLFCFIRTIKNFILIYIFFSTIYPTWVKYAFDRPLNLSSFPRPHFNSTHPIPPEQTLLFEKALHQNFEEALTLNVIGAAIIFLAVVIPCIVQFPKFRVRRGASVQDPRYQY